MTTIIESQKIEDAVRRLSIEATTEFDKELLSLLKKAWRRERHRLAKKTLQTILDNCCIAAEKKKPICQDTGLGLVFVRVGQNVRIKGNLEQSIQTGLAKGYREGYLRMSVVDPLTRVNTNSNTPGIIYTTIVKGDKLELTVIPKGFGSENMGQTKMLKPSEGIEGIIDFVVKAVKSAGANPCPPIFVGVGIGGTLEKAALLAKEALYEIDLPAKKREDVVALEKKLFRKINALGIGPAGFGGDTTCLKVTVKTFPTHVAGLPVAVNIGCWCHRAKTIRISYPNSQVRD